MSIKQKLEKLDPNDPKLHEKLHKMYIKDFEFEKTYHKIPYELLVIIMNRVLSSAYEIEQKILYKKLTLQKLNKFLQKSYIEDYSIFHSSVFKIHKLGWNSIENELDCLMEYSDMANDITIMIENNELLLIIHYYFIIMQIIEMPHHLFHLKILKHYN